MLGREGTAPLIKLRAQPSVLTVTGTTGTATVLRRFVGKRQKPWEVRAKAQCGGDVEPPTHHSRRM